MCLGWCPKPSTGILAWSKKMTSTGYILPIARSLIYDHCSRFLGVPLHQVSIWTLQICPLSSHLFQVYVLPFFLWRNTAVRPLAPSMPWLMWLRRTWLAEEIFQRWKGTRWEFYRPYVAFLFAVLVNAWCSIGPKILPLLQTDKFHATYDVALVSFQTSPMPDNHSVP